MNILVLNNRVPWPLNDGGNLVTFHVAKNLAERGHSVTLACLNTRKHFVDPADFPAIGELVSVDIDTSLSPLGLIGGLLSSFPYNVKRFKSGDFEAALVRLFQRKSFDLIQVEGSYMAIYVPLLRKLSQAPIILRSHNIEHEIWGRLAESQSGLKGFYLRNLTGKIKRFELDSMHGFDAIVAITERDRRWYVEHGFKGPVTDIPAGISTDVFAEHAGTSDPHSICFIGSLEWLPNVDALKWFVEKVWNPLHAQFPDVQFHVAGKNPPADLKNWLVPGMVFHGMVPDAYAFMAQHGILVTPLLSGGGMRVKVVEGMAMGNCIVSSPVGAEGVIFEDGVHLFIEKDAESFRNRLAFLLEHPEKVVEVGAAAHKHAVETYDWRKLVERFEKSFLMVNG